MSAKRPFSPFAYPIIFFLGAIAAGSVLLHSGISHTGHPLSWVDALFTATSATCVTGLAVVDTGTFFTPFGQSVILCLIQLGGLGIMTYTSLVFYLWRRRVRLSDRMAVGKSLLHDPQFHLGRFLVRIVAWTLILEAAGAFALRLVAPDGFSSFSAAFHSISAFCNAGFSLNRDSLMGFRGDVTVNLIFIALIVLGGIGFSVLVELEQRFHERVIKRSCNHCPRLSWYARVVLSTTLFLIVSGALAVFLSEFVFFRQAIPIKDALVSSLFQSVTCRTAGFNTLDVGAMTNASLLVMIPLMFIGGSPGSCAGGIKTTTFRSLAAFAVSQLKGRNQPVIRGSAVDTETMGKAITLIVFALFIVSMATIILTFTEGGDVPHPMARGNFMEILFETVSAFGTVGLSMGLTPKLTLAGKLIITCLMFIGRLGPIVFLTVLQGLHVKPHYSWPEETMLIG